MADFIFLMHDDAAPREADEGDPWGPYIDKLKASGCFEGGSEIGGGVCLNKRGATIELTPRIAGFIKVTAESLEQARELLAGNPVFERGGTVEIRELPRT